MDMILKVILQTDVSSGLTSKCLYLSHIKSENLTWTKKFVIVHVCFLSHEDQCCCEMLVQSDMAICIEFETLIDQGC